MRAKMVYYNKTINSLESELRYSPRKAVGVGWCVSMHDMENSLCIPSQHTVLKLPDAGERALEIHYTLDWN